ncbi:MFS transporter [Sphingomonas hengshuiensis]|uniref:Major facilitator superfamily (MFS) profile domain-containing protein n=1 Tax=Sphingomonas hengshuiensis TaxID=1609977 RepID=A0A7U5BEG8_9SPHN|nr:MFS transporter [Sphingomonas hengshuiensis]AJP70796.1 hypothetical protein TS85_01625 [Sphingomonas hengshuiensis]
MTINITRRIDSAPIGSFQIRVVLLCALVALLDGLDIQTMAIATPRIAQQWGMAPAAFGPVLSASFAGIMLGTMALGLAGDRLGRRRVVLSAFLVLGLLSVATAAAQSVWQLVLLRFATGFAIGGCLPNVTALTTEYMPARRAGTAVTLMYAAVPLGGVLGSLLAPPLIAVVDWHGIFLLGGIVPLAILGLLWAWLPESARFLVDKGGRDATVAAMLARIDRGYVPAPGDAFTLENRVAGRSSVAELFRQGRRATTILLWTIFFFSMAVMYLLNSWLPTIFTGAGWPIGDAIRTLAFFQFGGIAGGLIGGWLLDRIGPGRVLVAAFGFGTLCLVAIGLFGSGPGVVRLLVTGVGFGIIGAQLVLTAVSAIAYPTAIRATGIGWALGLGRFGAVISPILGGLALSAGVGGGDLFLCAAVPACLCTGCAILLSRQIGRARS